MILLRLFSTRTREAIVLLTIICLSSAILNIVLNNPYRPFPTDEFWTYSVPLRGEDWLATKSEILLNSPMHIYALTAVRHVTELLGLHWFQTFLVTVAISLSGTTFLIGLTVFSLTGNVLYTVAAALFFTVSAWGQAYLHFYTYAPVAALFMMASFYCFTRYFLAEAGNVSLAAAGFFAGIFFLSSSSAKLLFCILLGAYLLLTLQSANPHKKAGCFWMLGAALVPVLSLMPIYLEPLLAHVRTNLSSGNGIYCLQKYGFLPTTPFFSYFYLLRVYSPALLLFLLLSLIVAILKWKTLLQGAKQGVMVLALLGIILLHTSILDILPFTKLGRTQFTLLPLTIIALTVLYAEFPFGKRAGKWFFILFMLIATPLEIAASAHVREARRSAPTALEQLPKETAYLFLVEDPHREFITDWLGSTNTHVISQADLPTIVRFHSTPIALIVGPTGLNSGKSILQHSIMDDYYFSLPPNIGIVPTSVQKLPYYAHYPLFLMEEENSQCFYFRHQVPDSASPGSRLTVYFWQANYSKMLN